MVQLEGLNKKTLNLGAFLPPKKLHQDEKIACFCKTIHIKCYLGKIAYIAENQGFA